MEPNILEFNRSYRDKNYDRTAWLPLLLLTLTETQCQYNGMKSKTRAPMTDFKSANRTKRCSWQLFLFWLCFSSWSSKLEQSIFPKNSEPKASLHNVDNRFKGMRSFVRHFCTRSSTRYDSAFLYTVLLTLGYWFMYKDGPGVQKFRVTIWPCHDALGIIQVSTTDYVPVLHGVAWKRSWCSLGTRIPRSNFVYSGRLRPLWFCL